MAKYHVNPETGNPGVCRAKIKCKFGDMDSEHYSTKEEAREAYEAKRNSVPNKLAKKSSVNDYDRELMSILPTIHQQEYLQSDAFYNVNGIIDHEAIDNFTDYHYFKICSVRDYNDGFNEALAKYKFLNSDMGKDFHGYEHDSMYLLDGYSHDELMSKSVYLPEDNYDNVDDDFKDALTVRKRMDNDFYLHYRNETNRMLKNITPVQHNALAYWTCRGNKVINSFAYGDGTKPWGIQNTNPENDNYFDDEEYLRVIDEAFDSSPVGEAKILYRGLNSNIVGDAVVNEQLNGGGNRTITDKWLNENYSIGKVIEFKTPLSTSASPQDANNFSTSNIVYEIKSRKNLAIGGLSAWGYAEAEYLTPRNAKYKVVSILKDVPYEKFVNFRGESQNKVTVIQLEQIDE